MGIEDTVATFVSGLFASKKHYRLYYWNGAAWVFLLEGHPSQIRPAQLPYTEDGIPTSVIRWGNKASEKGVVPTAPPIGVAVAPGASAGAGGLLGSGSVALIAGAVIAVGVALFFLLKRGGKLG